MGYNLNTLVWPFKQHKQIISALFCPFIYCLISSKNLVFVLMVIMYLAALFLYCT